MAEPHSSVLTYISSPERSSIWKNHRWHLNPQPLIVTLNYRLNWVANAGVPACF